MACPQSSSVLLVVVVKTREEVGCLFEIKAIVSTAAQDGVPLLRVGWGKLVGPVRRKSTGNPAALAISILAACNWRHSVSCQTARSMGDGAAPYLSAFGIYGLQCASVGKNLIATFNG